MAGPDKRLIERVSSMAFARPSTVPAAPMKPCAEEARSEFLGVLIDAHEGLSESQSMKLNAYLLLALSRRVKSIEVLRNAVEEARQRTLANDERRIETPVQSSPRKLS